MRMSNVGLVMSAGMKNAFRIKIALIILASITLICVVGVALLLCLLLIAPEMESAVPNREALEGHLNLALYAASFISIGVTLNSLVFQTMIKEKTRGNLAALLATPLKVSEIWLGKSLALFVPGLAMSVLFTVLNLVIINIIYFLPEIGFIVNPQMLINSLILIPLVYLLFGMLVHLIGLTTKPATGNIIAQIFLPVFINVVAQLVARDVISVDSWQFLTIHLGLAAVSGGIILAFMSRLTPERVLLSAG